MAVQGPWTWFDQALIKIANGVIDLSADTFKGGFSTSSQALTEAFAGASTDCRYADLTNELATASGYTIGGVALTSVALTRAAGVVKWTAAPWSWTLSAGVTFKYGFIYDDTHANKPLLCFCDMDTGGGSVSPGAGLLTMTPDTAGILGWSQ